MGPWRAASADGPILVAGHVSEVYGPVQALERYLRDAGATFDMLTQPLLPSGVRDAVARCYRDGRAGRERRRAAPRRFVPLAYARQLRWVERTAARLVREEHGGEPYGLFVAIDVMNALAGLRLRRRGLVRRVVYYVIDWTPRRFRNRPLNAAYHAADRRAARGADVVWNISPRIQEVRRRQGIAQDRNRVVGVGVELDKIPTVPAAEVERQRVLFVSHLTRQKGADVALEAVADLRQEFPGLVLDIIGTGPHEAALRRRAAELGLNGAIRFHGAMDHDALLRLMPRCGVGLATYEDDPESITAYADPTKPKEYLACGLPVVITRTPWIAEEIERAPMGVAVAYNRREVREALRRLFADETFYWRCRENARAFTARLDWRNQFEAAFAALERASP